jgi:hypothetical protein
MNTQKPFMTAFRITPDEREQMERIKTEDGIPYQVQISQALTKYLAEKRVVRAKLQRVAR